MEDVNDDECVAVNNLLCLHGGVKNRSVSVDKDVQVKSCDQFESFESLTFEFINIHSMQLLDTMVDLITKYYPNKKPHKLSVKNRVIE